MRRFLIAMFFLALCGLAGSPSAAQDVPTVQALRAKIAAAAGALPGSRYERVRWTAFGITGTRTTVHAGDDFRETETDGPLQRAHGLFAKRAWHQNFNGQTVIEQSDPGNAVADAYVTTVSRVSTPADAYVVARLNSAGSGSKEFVDPRTFRVVRREYVQPAQTTVEAYDDFRTVSGYTSAWHWTRRDGQPENDGDYQVEAFEARPIATNELDVAPPRRALVEFPPGKTSVDLPVQMLRDTFIVRVLIDGRGYDFELDSGSAGISIDDGVAKALGLTTVARSSNSANAGRFTQSTVIVPQMRIGDLRMRDVALSTIPGSAASDTGGIKVVGLLGFDFIAEIGLRLDYEHGRATAISTDKPLDIQEAGTIPLDIRLGTQLPFTDVAINDAVGERFTIDTGNAGTLMILDYFARRYPKALVDRGGGAGRDSRFIGIGGELAIRPYRLARIKVGSVTFTDFVAYRIAERKTYAFNSDGFIGAQMLKFFTVWFDYTDSHIYLVPNGDGRRAMH